MKEILLISGKGGTGKTSLTSSFIYFADNCIACDYDVDASNLPILLQPQKLKGFDFSAGETAWIDEDSCISCGVCAALCRFEAIDSNYQVLPLPCEGCGFCSYICPVQAITMRPRPSGRWFSGVSQENQPVFFAELRPGEENSGKLVAQVKTMARKTAEEKEIPLIIADGPPGIGCAVISSMVGVDLVVLVTEPSGSGFHDLQRVSQLMRLRGMKGVIIINKWDLNPKICEEIEDWALKNNIAVAGRVAFSTEIAESITKAKIPGANGQIKEMLFPLWENIIKQLDL
ncbi:MAG: ATP-binding protein [Syntrophomonadaceae bacterium]|nr:ATP-binding protein [Syntrophomonadaceae bacterium]MDD3023128.1 ATP-binding protein [Syntrophomonadaceae bacterium]